jgi:hypothetical protein
VNITFEWLFISMQLSNVLLLAVALVSVMMVGVCGSHMLTKAVISLHYCCSNNTTAISTHTNEPYINSHFACT